MPDISRRTSTRKRALIAPLVIGVVLLAIVIAALAMHKPERPKPPVPTPAPAPIATPTVTTAQPLPPLSRADLVQDANAAASAYASGMKPSPSQPPLVGRRFSVRIPFGCGGPGAASATAQADVELDPQANTVRLTARPAIWTSLPLLQDLSASAKIEAVEGFWIPRPWVDSDACPVTHNTPLPATPTPAAAQTVGLARIFEKGGSRVLMRGERPYQFTLKLPKDDAAILGRTYRLVLEGRLVGFGDGQAAHCWSESPDHRPICLYAVDYDRVAFEDGESSAVLAEWRD